MSRYKYRLSIKDEQVGDFTSINGILQYLLIDQQLPFEKTKPISIFFRREPFQKIDLKTYVDRELFLRIETIPVRQDFKLRL
jgi:hypothetical protein